MSDTQIRATGSTEMIQSSDSCTQVDFGCPSGRAARQST